MRSLKSLTVLCALALLAALSAAAQYPFYPPTESDVRGHVLGIAAPLSEKYRVEIVWNGSDRVKKPNGAVMIGIPGTEVRIYDVYTLPSGLTPSRIADAVDKRMQTIAASASEGWWDRLRNWFRRFGRSNPLEVKKPIGLFVVKEFSTPQQLPE